MGETHLTVPVDHVETMRRAVYGRLASNGDILNTSASALEFPNGRSWENLIGDDPDKEEQSAVDVFKAAREIATLVALMDQLGWTDPIEGAVQLEGEAELLATLARDGLVDAGDVLDDVTDCEPFDRSAFDVATKRAVWFADLRDELTVEAG